MTNDMASRLANLRSIVPELQAALHSFQQSDSKFRVLRTIQPVDLTITPPSPPQPGQSPKTLFILDSSFNPPSIAHQALAESALHDASAVPAGGAFPKPHRLLLLFSTMNADKAPSAASFDQRLALMTLLAADVAATAGNHEPVPVDVGVTTAPYYTDKSAAIAAEGEDMYGSGPKHVHLLGFDTLTRLMAPKYYPKFDPPLSALEPYFDGGGHALRVTLRPDDGAGDGDGSLEDQRAFIRRMAAGEMEDVGAKRHWAAQIHVVPPNPKAGVSSTKIRQAAKARDWEVVRQLCTPSVAAWVESEALYEDDDKGAKMA